MFNVRKLSIAALLLVFLVSGVSVHAVSSSGIDDARKKTTLDDADIKAIDDYVANSINAMLEAGSFSDVARIRGDVVQRSPELEEVKYAEAFCNSLAAHCGSALKSIDSWSESKDKAVMKLNIMILLGAVGRLELAEVVSPYFEDSAVSVRYWAMRTLASDTVAEQLKSGSRIPAEVMSVLEKAVGGETSAEIVTLVCEFASKVNSAEADKVLLAAANNRIKAYESWKVNHSLSDAKVLAALGERLAGSQSKAQIGRAFGQLFSYLVQKYNLVLTDEIELGDECLRLLASAIIKTERDVIKKRLNITGVDFKTSIDKDKAEAITADAEKLLNGASGLLPAKYSFDYGTDDSGAKLTSPKVLARRPEKSEEL